MQYTVSFVQEKDATVHTLFSTELAVIVIQFTICVANSSEIFGLSVQPGVKLQVTAFHADDLKS